MIVLIDIVWKLKKKNRKKWIHEYIFNCWKYIWLKASSKITLNNKVTLVAIMIYLLYRFCYNSEGGNVWKERSLRKTFYCLGVGQVTWLGCGKFQCCRTDQEAHSELSWAVTDKRKHGIFILNGLVKRL